MNKKLIAGVITAVVVVASVVIVNGCKKDKPLHKSREALMQAALTGVEMYAPTEYNLNMRNFALVVNEAMQSEHFRSIIRDVANEQIDGDFDVLISTVLDRPVSHDGESVPMRMFFNKCLLRLQEKEEIVRAFSLENLYEKYPALQISIPVNIEQLSDRSVIPPVAFLTEEYVEGSLPILYAFKGSERVVIDGIEVPTFAVACVGLCERMYCYGKFCCDPNIDGLCGATTYVPDPQNLRGATCADGISLVWDKAIDANATNTDGYCVYRKGYTAVDTFLCIACLHGVDNTDYIDIDCDANHRYFYYVKAVKRVSCVDVSTTPPTVRNGVGSSNASNHIAVDAPPRPNAPLSLKVKQSTLNDVSLMWTLDNSQAIGSVKVHKTPESGAGFNVMATYGSNVYSCLDNNIAAYRGRAIEYGIQTVAGANLSNIVYDFTHISYRDPEGSSNVKIDKIEVTDRAMEPWGMGPPEFRIIVMGYDRATNKSCNLSDVIYCDFKNTLKGWWNNARTQTFNKQLYEWRRDAYSENYEIITIHIQEVDYVKMKKLGLKGSIGAKGGIGINDTSKDPSPYPFSAGVTADFALEGEVEFFKDKNMGWKRMFYFENPKQTFKYDAIGSMNVYITD